MDATVGLIGVIVGALTSIIASVAVPWLRDGLDRRRVAKESRAAERRQWLMNTLAALYEFRQTMGDPSARGIAQAKFGDAFNQLTVRFTREEQPVLDVLLAMFVMIQSQRPGVEAMVGEAMQALTLWERGDIATADVIPEVERRAAVKFSSDRRTVTPT